MDLLEQQTLVVVEAVVLELQRFLAHKVVIHHLIVLLVPVVAEQEEVEALHLLLMLTEDLAEDLEAVVAYLENKVDLEIHLL